MNKAMMIAIQPKWSKMIKDGLKKFEFRNYAIPKGTKVYLYESLGERKPKHLWENYPLYIEHRWSKNEDVDILSDYVTEGWGMVVAEFVVGEIWDEDDIDGALFEEPNLPNYFAKTGYTNQKYAMEIKDLIVYDEEWIGDIERDLPRVAENINYFDMLEFAPTSPLDTSEFVSWNKIKEGLGCGYMNIPCDLLCKECIKTEHKLTHPPQGKVYVVEKIGGTI